VSDNDIPTSGSRWEPGGHTATEHAATPTDVTVAMVEEGAVQAEHGAVPADRARGGRLPRRLRNRTAAAAAGVGLVLAGGLGGFAIGHAIADSDAGISNDADQNGVPDGPRDGAGHGGRPDFERDGDGQDAPGTAPDGSTPDDSGSSSGDDEGGSA
jgi:hypothetical protein